MSGSLRHRVLGAAGRMLAWLFGIVMGLLFLALFFLWIGASCFGVRWEVGL